MTTKNTTANVPCSGALEKNLDGLADSLLGLSGQEILNKARDMTTKNVNSHDSEAARPRRFPIADYVLELSDEEILDEVRKSGADPKEYAERTRDVLRQALQKFDNVNKRLRELGHAIMDWQAREEGYENKCKNCGLSVSFSATSNEIWGEASIKPCRARDQYTSEKKEAAGR